MRKLIYISIFVLLISCNKTEVNKISGVFENRSLELNDPSYFWFQNDSVFIKYFGDVKIFKSKITYKSDSLFKISFLNKDVDFKVFKSTTHQIMLFDKLNTFSIKDTIALNRVDTDKLKISDDFLKGFWYSDDYLILSRAQSWLKFDEMALTLKYRYCGSEENIQQFNYYIEKFGNLNFLNITYAGVDGVLLLDNFSNEQIQFYTIDPKTNNKFFTHLNKIDSIKFKNLLFPKQIDFSIDSNENDYIEIEEKIEI
jgi:hypothetical protein